MLISDYTAYFEMLAQQHHLIRHNPDSLNGDSEAGEQRFAIYNAEDVLASKFRSKLGYPALLVEMYEVQFGAAEVYDPKMQYRGAFSIICHGSPKERNTEAIQLSTAEAILWDIIQRIYSDHYGPNALGCNSPFSKVDVMNAQLMPFGPIWDWDFGWRCEFGFRPKATRQLTQLPAAGVFITP